MARIEIGKYLAADSRVCGGRLIFKGSRIKVADAVELSQANYTPAEIAHQYWEIITPVAVEAALDFMRRGIIEEQRIEEEEEEFVNRIEIGKYLATDSRVCDGKLIFKGSRIMVADAVSRSRRGYSAEEIAHQFRGIITPAAVEEALAYVQEGFIREIDIQAVAAA